jgi:predicted peptidase
MGALIQVSLLFGCKLYFGISEFIAMKRTLLLLPMMLLAATLLAQDLSLFQKRWLVQGTDTLPYRLLLPKNFDATKEYPLVLVLHGAGERGNDNEAQLVHGAKLFVQDSVRDRFPAIVVFPQCPRAGYWAPVQFGQENGGRRTFGYPPDAPATRPMQLVMQLLDTLNQQYSLDDDRMYVGGLSMGGMGTFDLVARKPRTFAAAFPICGGGAPEHAKALRRTKWWVFHGDADAVVPWQLSEIMVAAIKQQRRASVKFTLYPGVNHNSWDNAFAEPQLLPWLFAQKN